MRVCKVTVTWSVLDGDRWRIRPDVIARLGPMNPTCWPVAEHSVEVVGAQRRTDFEYVLSDPSALSWPGRYRVSLRVHYLKDEHADSPSRALVDVHQRFLASEFIEFDVAPAASAIRETMDASRDQFGQSWRAYVQVMNLTCVATFPAMHAAPAGPPAAFAEAMQQSGLSRESAKVARDVIQLAASMGPEVDFLFKVHQARRDVALAMAGAPDSAALLESAATLLSMAAASSVAEERRAVAIVALAGTRRLLGQQAMAKGLELQVATSAALPRMRKLTWFDAEVRRSLSLP
jgi:hypothetical protein